MGQITLTTSVSDCVDRRTVYFAGCGYYSHTCDDGCGTTNSSLSYRSERGPFNTSSECNAQINSFTCSPSTYCYYSSASCGGGPIRTYNAKSCYTVNDYCVSYGQVCYVNTIVNYPDFAVRGESFEVSYLSDTQNYSNVVYQVDNGTYSGNTVTPNQNASQVTVYVRSTHNYNGRTCQAQNSFTIPVRLNQEIYYTGPEDFIVGNLTNLSAQSSVGLTNFSYSCDQEGATVQDNQILFDKLGVYNIRIVEAGNDQYASKDITVSVVCGIDNLSPSLMEISTLSGGGNG